eukprot:1161417-Pelagomonas_calceolata.AAC.10
MGLAGRSKLYNTVLSLISLDAKDNNHLYQTDSFVLGHMSLVLTVLPNIFVRDHVSLVHAGCQQGHQPSKISTRALKL